MLLLHTIATVCLVRYRLIVVSVVVAAKLSFHICVWNVFMNYVCECASLRPLTAQKIVNHCTANTETLFCKVQCLLAPPHRLHIDLDIVADYLMTMVPRLIVFFPRFFKAFLIECL